MVVKLTPDAGETLNDIVLHRLQNEGLEKAESMEQSFYDEFERICISPDAQNMFGGFLVHENAKAAAIGQDYIAVYQVLSEEIVILDIYHASRHPQFF